MIPVREYPPALFLHILWLRKGPLLAGLILGAVAGTALVRDVPNAYRAFATIMVQPQLVPQNLVRSTASQSLEDRIRTMAEQVLSPEQLAPIAAELNLYDGLSIQESVARLRALFAVNVLRADAFRVGFVHRSPETAARVAQRIAEAFVAENTRARSGLAENADQFIGSQLENTRQRLADHEEKLETYRRTYSGQLPSQLSANMQSIQNAQVQLRASDEAIHQDRDRKLLIEQTLANLTATEPASADAQPQADTATAVETVPVDPFTDQVLLLRGREALRQLPEVRSTLQSLQLQLKPDHPDITRLKRVIGELERRILTDLGPSTVTREAARAQLLDQQRTRSVDQLWAEAAAIEERLAEREADRARLTELAQVYQQRVDLSPTRETEITMLMRDYETLRDSYLGLLAKKQETELSMELERRNAAESFRIVEAARPPNRPFSPDRWLFALEGSGIGFVLVLLFVGWGEYRDETLRTEKEVIEGLAIPVLALIPVIVTDRDRRRIRLRRSAWAVAVAGLALAAGLLYLRAVGRL